MEHFKDSVTQNDITLFKLLEVINNQPAGIAFINNDENKLIGVVTDGDLRRLLLQGYNLDDNLSKISLPKFTYAKDSDSVEEIIAKANDKIRLIPIVNDENEIVDYFRYDKRIYLPVANPDLSGNELKYVTDALLSTWISSAGEYINRFESGFAEFCGTKYGVATSNGTVAIHLALDALGIGAGDEVIVPDLTFAATINAVLYTGATPVIVDVEMDSWCIDPDEIEKAITPRTKAVIPVHVYGQVCDMDRIMEISKRHDIHILEDAAEAHGATFKDQRVGSFGIINTFSFFANKIITSGEGGMCMTNSEELKDTMRMLRDHGMNKQKRYWHDRVGYNYRMTNVQAAIAVAQLERIDEIIAGRDNLETKYMEILKDNDFITYQQNFPGRKKTVWLISMLAENFEQREEVIAYFKANKIDIRPFFYPLSDMPIYQAYFKSSKDYRNSKILSKRGFSVPTHKDVNLERFENVWKEFLASRK